MSNTDTEKQNYQLKMSDLIEKVLERSPKHPIHHYMIHLWDDGQNHYRALDSARDLGPSQPWTAHLWHMPTHIFTDTHDRFPAWLHAEVAHRVDNKQIGDREIMPSQIHNYIHNYRDYAMGHRFRVGQLSPGLRVAKVLMAQGRLPSSRKAHFRLVSITLGELLSNHQYEDIIALKSQGFLSDLRTGKAEFDLPLQSEMSRILVRSYLETGRMNEAIKERKVLVGLQSKSAGLSDQAVKDVVVKNRLDADLWFELLQRKGQLGIPQLLLQKILDQNVTPVPEIILFAQKNGHSEFAKRLFTSFDALAKDATSIANGLDLLAYLQHAGRSKEDIYTQLRETVVQSFIPPVLAEDFKNFDLAQNFPDELISLLEEVTNDDSARQLEGEFAYLDLDLDEFGPEHPRKDKS